MLKLGSSPFARTVQSANAAHHNLEHSISVSKFTNHRQPRCYLYRHITSQHHSLMKTSSIGVEMLQCTILLWHNCETSILYHYYPNLFVLPLLHLMFVLTQTSKSLWAKAEFLDRFPGLIAELIWKIYVWYACNNLYPTFFLDWRFWRKNSRISQASWVICAQFQALLTFSADDSTYFFAVKTNQRTIFGHWNLLGLCMKLTMILLLFKLRQERLGTQLTSKQKGVEFGSTVPKKDICLEMNVLFLRITYLLLTEFEGSTVSYGVPFFHFNLWPKCEAWGPWIEVEKQCGAHHKGKGSEL